MAESDAAAPTFADLLQKVEMLRKGRLTKDETGEDELDDIRHVVRELEVRCGEDARYQALFDSAPLGYFVLDTGTKIRDVNESGLNLLRTSREHVVGESLDVFFDPDSQPALQKHLEKAMDLRTAQRCRLRLQGRGPGSGEVEVVSLLAPEPVNDEVYILLTMAETTEQADRSRRLADLGRFSAWIAHELRQPLSSLKLAVYNISKKCRDPDVGVHLQHADEKIREADQIINNVLAASALTAPNVEETDLRKLIDGCIDGMERRLPTARIRFVRKLDALSGVRAAVDPGQIRQVIRHLFQNACEALGDKDGAIVIRGFLGEGSVGFSVTDTDDGISEDDLEKVTDLFYTTKHRGVGIGLSLALELVKMNGGSLTIDSTPGRGTTVTATLPRRPERGEGGGDQNAREDDKERDGDPLKSQ